MVSFLVICILLGGFIILVSSSPYHGVFGVLLQAISLAILLGLYGAPFLGLLLILVYVGGMLVVFLFSTILSAERFPEFGLWEVLFLWVGVGIFISPFLESWRPRIFRASPVVLKSELGVGEVFGSVWFLMSLIAVILLIALVSVLVLSFEHTKGALRSL